MKRLVNAALAAQVALDAAYGALDLEGVGDTASACRSASEELKLALAATSLGELRKDYISLARKFWSDWRNTKAPDTQFVASWLRKYDDSAAPPLLPAQPKKITNEKGAVMEYVAIQDKQFLNDWRSEAIESKTGDCFVVVFSGPEAEQRARQFTDWQNSNTCKHPEWKASDSQSDTEVRCVKCGEVGARNEATGAVFYPAT